MELTTKQKYIIESVLCDKLFKMNHHIAYLEYLDQTDEMKFHIKNLKDDYNEIKLIQKKLVQEISLEQVR